MSYGLNYAGSKNAICDEIVAFMLNRHPDKDIFIDAFCGGFAVSDCVLKNYPFMHVIANDLDADMIALLKLLQDPAEKRRIVDYYSQHWVSREEWRRMLDAGGYLRALAHTLYCFGGNYRSYLYGKDKEEAKRQAFEEARRHGGRARVQHLESLKRLERLKRLDPSRMELHCGDALTFLKSLPEETLQRAIVYCDPPYENTSDVYSFSDKEGNLTANLALWASEAQKRGIPLYVSSYEDAKEYGSLSLAWKGKKAVLMQSGSNRHKTELIRYNGAPVAGFSLIDYK